MAHTNNRKTNNINRIQQEKYRQRISYSRSTVSNTKRQYTLGHAFLMINNELVDVVNNKLIIQKGEGISHLTSILKYNAKESNLFS